MKELWLRLSRKATKTRPVAEPEHHHVRVLAVPYDYERDGEGWATQEEGRGQLDRGEGFRG